MSIENLTDSIGAGRYNIAQVANRLPGSCCFCQSSTGPFIDTGRYFKMFGNVYICVNNCLREMAELAQITEVTIQYAEPGPDSLTRTDFEEAIREHVSPLLSAVSDLSDYLVGASIIPLLSETDEDDGDVSGSAAGAVSTPLEVIEPGSVEGPNGLSDDSVDGLDDADGLFRD